MPNVNKYKSEEGLGTNEEKIVIYRVCLIMIIIMMIMMVVMMMTIVAMARVLWLVHSRPGAYSLLGFSAHTGQVCLVHTTCHHHHYHDDHHQIVVVFN